MVDLPPSRLPFAMAPSRAVRPLFSICRTCLRHRSSPQRCFSALQSRQSEGESRLPRIANPSLWSGLVPKFLRRAQDPVEAAERAQRKATRPKVRNEYTVFIVLGILVGSNAIQLIALRNEMLNFSRKTDAKLELLREVVQKVKNGEDVDVRGLLGTGDPAHEKEWEEVMRELEETDMLLEGRKKREAKRAEKAEQQRLKDEQRAREREASPVRADGVESVQQRRPKFII